MVDMNDPWETIEGETPIDPSHLNDRTIRTRAELNRAEAENVRKAHMLSNIWLSTHDQPLVKWPEATIGGTSPVRQEYLRALQEADKNDYHLLIALHCRFLERS
ncbi:MAG: hypothetical protein V3R99_10040 [Thermoguttaceae bacterium]